MRNFKFLCVLTLISLAIICLAMTLYHQAGEYAAVPYLVMSQGMGFLSCFMLLGIGIGLPLVLLASVMGWVQLLLLMSGNIDPHLSKEGFQNVLRILFSKI